MTGLSDRLAAMAGLVRALLYLRLFKGRVFVLKAGGVVCADPAARRDLADQVAVLHELGVRVVLVHGGGPQTTALAARLGVESRMVDGRRVTTPELLDVAVMTLNGTVNTALVSAMRAAGLPAVGLSGLDAGLVKAVARPPTRQVVDGREQVLDWGRVGDVSAVDAGALGRLLDAGFLPVLSSLCADDAGSVLNVNADTVAAAVAVAVGARKLVFLTDTPGLLADRNDPGSLVSYVDVKGLEAMRLSGAVDAGMLPKVRAVLAALEGGVPRVHLVGHRAQAALLVEVFTNEGAGTLVVRDTADLSAAEQQP
jgi:acetylglutamate kinase